MFTVIAEDEVTVEDIQELVNNDNFESLDDSVIGVIAAALSDEDDSVKEVFEEAFDIFSGAAEDYVPSGSNVTVAERRIIIAATAVVMAVPVPAPQVSSSGSGGSGGGQSDRRRQ